MTRRSPGRLEAPAAQSEAAAWVARLQGPERTAQTEQAFRSWMQSDPSHGAAFDQATVLWEALGGIGPSFQVFQRRRRRRQAVGWALAASVAVMVAGVQVRPLFGPAYAAEHGEQRTLALADGSVVTLNTDSQVTVLYGWGRRGVRLDRGEAFFKVAEDSRRPFVVAAGGREIRALGTAFEVFRAESDLVVTLVEGKVGIAAPALLPMTRGDPPVVLAPGQSWRRSTDRVALLDGAALDAATAWRRRELVLRDTPLAEAVAEMNRYAEAPLVIDDRAAGDLHVSGIFNVKATESFARTVAALYGLKIRREAGSIHLSRDTGSS